MIAEISNEYGKTETKGSGHLQPSMAKNYKDRVDFGLFRANWRNPKELNTFGLPT